MNATTIYTDWYQRHFPKLTGQGLWLRGGELNTLSPEEFEKRPFRVLFARLSTYEDTGVSFTHPLLYALTSQIPGFFPDLAYLPPKKDWPLFEAQGTHGAVPWLLGTQTKRGAMAFDVVGFSNAILQELINLPTLLQKSGIPLQKSERMRRADLPLLLLGGANALHSSVLWGPDPWVDGVFVGENTSDIERLFTLCRDAKAKGLSKTECLGLLSREVPGFFEPDRIPNQPPILKSRARSLPAKGLIHAPLLFTPEDLGSTTLQISEGCPCFCNFCAESWSRKPYHERNLAENLKLALTQKAAQGADSIDLSSFNFNTYASIRELLWELIPHFRKIGLKSQRLDLLAHDTAFIEIQKAVGKSSFTCGIEGISPRLRKFLHKNLENEELMKSLSALLSARIRDLKIFLIATGKEEEQDFSAFATLMDELKQLHARSSGTRIIVSMTPLVRFPWTPLEFDDAYPVAHYQKIINRVAQIVRQVRFEFREASVLSDAWLSQILARAARPEIGKALQETITQTQFVYFRNITPEFTEAFAKNLERAGLSPDELLKGFSLEESHQKPWAHIQTGVLREFLWQQLEQARNFEESGYCLGRPWTSARCSSCGACESPEEKQKILVRPPQKALPPTDFQKRFQLFQKQESTHSLLLEISSGARGVPRKVVGMALARALMLTDPRLAPLYRGYKGSFWTDEDTPVWAHGLDVLKLSWLQSALPLLDARFKDPNFIQSVNQHLGHNPVSWGRLIGTVQERWIPQSITVDPTGHRSGASPRDAFQPDKFLKDHGLKYTLRKQADGTRQFEFTPPSLKKGIILGLTVDPTGKIELKPGPKFQPQQYLSDLICKSFSLADPSETVRMNVTVHT